MVRRGRYGAERTLRCGAEDMVLEGVDHVHGGDGLPFGVLGVGDGVADHVLQEDHEHAAGILVDQAGDPLDAAPPGQAPDGRLGCCRGEPSGARHAATRPMMSQPVSPVSGSAVRRRAATKPQADSPPEEPRLTGSSSLALYIKALSQVCCLLLATVS